MFVYCYWLSVQILILGVTSNSISGIRRYKYWPMICTPRILLFWSEIQSTDTQIKYKPPIVTTRLNLLSYFVVYIFQSLFTFFNICTQIFTLSRSCRDKYKFCVFLLHLRIPAIVSLGVTIYFWPSSGVFLK